MQRRKSHYNGVAVQQNVSFELSYFLFYNLIYVAKPSEFPPKIRNFGPPNFEKRFIKNPGGRENKNRYVFSFLSALVQLGVFSSITMDFLLVGHTGIYNYA